LFPVIFPGAACPLAYLHYHGSETALAECPSVQGFLDRDLSDGNNVPPEDLIRIHSELNYMYGMAELNI
jgi:hypothetical protein